MARLTLATALVISCCPAYLHAQLQDSVLTGVRGVQAHVELGWDPSLQPRHNPLRHELEAALSASFASGLRKAGLQVGDSQDKLLVCSAKAVTIGEWAVVTWDVALIERAQVARLPKLRFATTWVTGGILYTEPDSLASKYGKLGGVCADGFTSVWAIMNRP